MTPTPEKYTSGAVIDVLKERERQITSEGWSKGHDDSHAYGELSMAADSFLEFQIMKRRLGDAS